jgi:hypothetical protein
MGRSDYKTDSKASDGNHIQISLQRNELARMVSFEKKALLHLFLKSLRLLDFR